MTLIIILLVLALVGFAVWALITFVPMPPVFKGIIIAVAAIACIVWLLDGVGWVHLPPLR